MIKTIFDPQDVGRLLDLGKQFHQESQFSDSGYDAIKCRMLLEKTLELPQKLFLAYDDQFQGLVFLQMATQFFNSTLWAGDQAFYVVPQARGTGLAVALLNAGYEWAKQNGASELVILHNAGIGMDKARAFYERQGFGLSGLIFKKPINGN